MRYLWRFSVIDKDGEVLRTDEVIAPTAADAYFIYNHNVESWTYDEQKILSYLERKQGNIGKFYTDGYHRILNKIQIDCLGEVEVKLKTESPIPVIDAPEELIDYDIIASLILDGGFEKIDKFYSTRNILGEYIYVYKTLGGKLWNMWPDSNGWQVVYYGCTSAITIYSANDFYKLYQETEGKPFPLNPQIPGHRSER